MDGQLRSILLGTSGLTIVAATSLALARSGPRPGQPGPLGAVRRLGWLAVAAQALHFGEEWLGGFPDRFPTLLGLAAWPTAFFVGFNVAWLAAWILVLVRPFALPGFTLFALWFLAIAGLINGIAHPLLALATGGYFPGLWTAPLTGTAGLLLLLALARYRGAADA